MNNNESDQLIIPDYEVTEVIILMPLTEIQPPIPTAYSE